jgi:ubiquinone biosynthesis monooxygenase Coq7
MVRRRSANAIEKEFNNMEQHREIVRPQMMISDFKDRGEGVATEQLKKIKKGLRTLHTLELMAQNIYKFQITKERSELNRQLIAAMCNEMSHYQDFQVKLYEYGWKPSPFRWAFWIVGFCFGFFSRIMGRRMILKTAIWVESLAVKHYSQLISDIPWDDDTRAMMEKNWDDEKHHVDTWTRFLG